MIFDRETNKSRGFGFVTYDPEERDACFDAIDEMHEKDLDGRKPVSLPLSVDFSLAKRADCAG